MTADESCEIIKVSGRGTLVNFEIDDSVSIGAACSALQKHLRRDRHLYADGEVTVNIGRRMLSANQRARIGKVMRSESGLTVKQFWCQPDILEEERARIADLLVQQSAIVRQHSPNGSNRNGSRPDDDSGAEAEVAPAADDRAGDAADDHAGVEIHQEIPPNIEKVPVGGLAPGGERYGFPALIVRGTCRAGEVLTFPGNVVILGNVNAGAKIVADGDILVFGALRGMAHAGAGGDTTAIILAMSTANPSFRISEYSWHDDEPRAAPERRRDDGNGATIARVRNGAIHIAPYLRNYAINHGGNPNER